MRLSQEVKSYGGYGTVPSTVEDLARQTQLLPDPNTVPNASQKAQELGSGVVSNVDLPCIPNQRNTGYLPAFPD
jgi:hypothetical protein